MGTSLSLLSLRAANRFPGLSSSKLSVSLPTSRAILPPAAAAWRQSRDNPCSFPNHSTQHFTKLCKQFRKTGPDMQSELGKSVLQENKLGGGGGQRVGGVYGSGNRGNN